MKQLLEVNDRVTIHNINPKIYDRSYQTDVWGVKAVNKTHAQLQSIQSRGILGDKIVILLEEYEFADASSFAK